MWWTESWMAIQQEFSDLGDASDVTRVCLRLLVALALGALLGYERESVGASAGLRTHMLVSLGSALFVLVPYQAGMALDDIIRYADLRERGESTLAARQSLLEAHAAKLQARLERDREHLTALQAKIELYRQQTTP